MFVYYMSSNIFDFLVKLTVFSLYIYPALLQRTISHMDTASPGGDSAFCLPHFGCADGHAGLCAFTLELL